MKSIGSDIGWPLVAGCVLAAIGLALPPGPQGNGATGTRVPPTLNGGGTADSNGTMIAVTGTDVTGSSVLYLIDTVRRQLAVYQATGGSSSTQGVELVGARRIALDLELDGFNDNSEYTYKELRDELRAKGLLASPAGDEAGRPGDTDR